MASLSDIVESAGWRKFMSKLYGLGASVVIVGALFKINHWKGATFMLAVGMFTEAVIFFFSAFEPLHEELDWTLVYPELSGMTDQDEMEQMQELTPGFGGRPLERIENILGDASINEDTLKNIGNGLEKLNKAASGIADISGASAATQEFLSHLQAAAGTVSSMNEAYNSSVGAIKESAANLASAYAQSAQQVTQSGSEVSNTYMQIAETIKNENQLIAQGGKDYESHLESLNKNLSALNSVYELQVKESNEHLKGAQQVYSGVEDMIRKLKDSVDETNRYKDEIMKLRDNLTSLNSIYGNMLSSMNVMINK
ncbi:MAG: gliding motility protein GldL [Bacteroidales bacterium]|nr:gliding motility protein GldL [Bacteroidales bacterium]MBN2762919.1 gliding motility protein GldL [Bacteroidales bacterium]